jgi:2-dehydro-3-deoxygalactonokinase
MERLVAVVDMGTTNTRLALVDRVGTVHGAVKGEFGCKDRAAAGKPDVLIEGLRELMAGILSKKRIEVEQIDCMLCSGMITSEIGLVEIPHRLAPVTAQELAQHAEVCSMPEILPAPIVFIPGVRNRVENPSLSTLEHFDFMRGEETQVFGAVDLYEVSAPVTFMFLSSHTKLVDLDEEHRITRSFTTLSGQIFDALRFHTLLTSSLPAEDTTVVDGDSLFRGLRAGLKNGVLRSGLMVRFMDTLLDTTPSQRFSFLEGLVIASDLRAMTNSYPHLRSRIALLGNPVRAEAYQLAMQAFLDHPPECRYLGEDSMERTAIRGALTIAALRPELWE